MSSASKVINALNSFGNSARTRVREVINKPMCKTSYPDVCMSFNEWTLYVRNEIERGNVKQLNTK
jgi:hypothetical protein